MKRLGRGFFARKPEVVARELLGKLLVRKAGEDLYIGKIVETEAYLGPGDKASHSHQGKTKRNEVMFGKAGMAYIYFAYGMHWLLNIITEKEGQPSGVLIRALEPVYGSKNKTKNPKISSGPAKLTKWMEIDGSLYGEDLTKSKLLFIVDNYGSQKSEKVLPKDIVARPRIGIEYAEEHKDLLLRFYIKDNKYVSKR